MSRNKQLYADEINVGTALPEYVWEPSHIQLFRFSAVTWNAHRIHYDQQFAKFEGYPDILVQSHLHGGVLAQMVMDWAGPGATLKKFAWTNRHFAVLGDVLRCSGVVESSDGEVVTCALEEINEAGNLVVTASAQVAFPTSSLTPHN